MNLREELEVAKQLERLKVDVIEARFAVASKGNFAIFKAIAESVKGYSNAALARTKPDDIDAVWEALRNAEQPRIHILIATSPIHMGHKLKMTPEQVLEATERMVRYARKKCSNV